MASLRELLDQVDTLQNDITTLSTYYCDKQQTKLPENSNVLMLFMANASRYRALTREEERELSIRKVAGDKEALSVLIVTNLRLVIKIAHDFKNRGVDLEDLVAEGLTGLIKGIKKYNPICANNNNAKLSTYAAWWVKQAMHRCIANHSKLIRIPVQSASNLNKIKKATNKLRNENKDISIKTIADTTGLSLETVKNLSHVSVNCVSLDAIIDEESDETYSAYFEAGNLDTEIQNKDTLNRLYRAIEALSPREQLIVKERFGLITGKKKSLTELEPVIGRTRERIRQLEKKALEKLKVILSDVFEDNPAYDFD